MPRFLIVNADDFGLSHGVNLGIIRAHEEGILTSASLMVRFPGAVEAAACAKAHSRLSVGLHLDLGEWKCVNDEWTTNYQVVPLDQPEAIAREVSRQLEAFRELMGCGPTHLDSHQHAHRDEPARSIILEQARALEIPLRDLSSNVHYCGQFYGQSDKGYPYPEGISVEALMSIIQKLPGGITELGCHPGQGSDVESVYCRERSIECETLCAAQVRETLTREGVVLRSFAEIRDLRGADVGGSIKES